MKCEECKWWDLTEKDVEVRKELKDDVSRLAKKFCSDEEYSIDDIHEQLEYQDILDSGYCTRYPPVIRKSEDVDGNVFEWFGVFPRTRFDSWCGEFVNKELK